MSDPRNIAHDKKVQQEKKHHHEEIAPGADKTPEPGKKTHMANHATDAACAAKWSCATPPKSHSAEVHPPPVQY